MSARTMTLMILGLALAVTALPNNREQPAAASDGLFTVTSTPALSEVAPAADYFFRIPAAGPQQVAAQIDAIQCDGETCQAIQVPEGTICHECGQVHARPRIRAGEPITQATRETMVMKSVSYAQAQPQTVYRVRQPVFRSSERFMQRGPARRFCGRVGRGVCRVALAPIRWLRGR